MTQQHISSLRTLIIQASQSAQSVSPLCINYQKRYCISGEQVLLVLSKVLGSHKLRLKRDITSLELVSYSAEAFNLLCCGIKLQESK